MAVGAIERGNEIEEGSFAGTIGSHESYGPSRQYRKTDLPQHGPGLVGKREAFYGE